LWGDGLSGRNNLFLLSKKLTEEGAITILGGPQANVDFLGEKDWRTTGHRFRGLSRHFSLAVTGFQMIFSLNIVFR